MTVAGLLLAAGESTRMGSPKPLLDWQGRPLIQYQIQQLQSGGCDMVVVVLGHRADRVLPFVPDSEVRVVINPLYRQGRATSIRAGAAAIPADVGWVVVLGADQPRAGSIIRQVVQAARSSTAAIVMPAHHGRHGHPTAFAGRLLPELAEVRDETLGLRAVIQHHEREIQEVEIPSAGVLLDLNTPEDYLAARSGRSAA